MQKKLIALAVAGLASSAAFAQSNVTIYGLLQPSYDVMKMENDGGVNAAGDTSVSAGNMAYNNSRIGFKGSEDLGNGLKAIFQVESKVDLVDRGRDAGGLADRDSWIGLAGSFGSFTVGNHQSAYTRVANVGGFDSFADSISDINNIMGVNGNLGVDFNDRFRKSMYYTSPKMAGFRVDLSYALQEGIIDNAFSKAAATKDNVVSASLTYANGGLTVIAGYETQDAGVAAGRDLENQAMKLGASYKFAFGTKIAGQYEQLKVKGVDTTTTANKVNNYMLGVTHPLSSNLDLAASYLRASDSNVAGVDDGARNYNLGVNYKLSKRTSIQGFYTHLKNKEDGTQGLDSGYTASDVAAGGKVSGFSVRLRHAF